MARRCPPEILPAGGSSFARSGTKVAQLVATFGDERGHDLRLAALGSAVDQGERPGTRRRRGLWSPPPPRRRPGARASAHRRSAGAPAAPRRGAGRARWPRTTSRGPTRRSRRARPGARRTPLRAEQPPMIRVVNLRPADDTGSIGRGAGAPIASWTHRAQGAWVVGAAGALLVTPSPRSRYDGGIAMSSIPLAVR